MLRMLLRSLLKTRRLKSDPQPAPPAMSLLPHPVPFSSSAIELLETARRIGPQLEAAADRIDANRTLPPDIVELLKQCGFFRMTMPIAWGGLEIDPMTQLLVIEQLASSNAAVGWCVKIGSDGGYFSGFLDQDIARKLYSDIDMITGSGLYPMGRADITSGGYRVSGRWRFGSGCKHSDLMAGCCIVRTLGVPMPSSNGTPRLRLCLFPAASVRIHDTWHSSGLRGTGSHDWEVEDVFVPEEHTYDVLNPQPQRSGPLYQLPHMIASNLAGVALGIARRAIDSFIHLATNKSLTLKPGFRLVDEPNIQMTIAQAIARYEASRALLLQSLTDVWQTLLNPAADQQSDASPFHCGTNMERLTLRQRALYRLSPTFAQEACVDVVMSLYRAAGASALLESSTLNECMRDIQAMSLHNSVSDKSWETSGKLLCGLRPEEPFA